MKTFFDPIAHQYYLNDRPVPSVTQVLRAVLPGAAWSATQWHMDRGTAVHACAALIAQGKQFEHDPAIAGQVAACRKFFAEVMPCVIDVEKQVFSECYQFAGTFDMTCLINGKTTIVDWKSSLSPVADIQIGAYKLAGGIPGNGMVVALQDDGNYKTSGIVNLLRPTQEFLACRSVYGIKQRLGLIKSREETTDGN